MDDQACSCKPEGPAQTDCPDPPSLPPLPEMDQDIVGIPGVAAVTSPSPPQASTRVYQGEDIVIPVPSPPEGFEAKVTLGDVEGLEYPIYEGLFGALETDPTPIVAVPGCDTESMCPGLYAWDVFFVPVSKGCRDARVAASGFITLSRTVGSGRTTVNPNLAGKRRPPRKGCGSIHGCGPGKCECSVASFAYVHHQKEEAMVWIVNHNLGYKPLVGILVDGVTEAEALVTHPSANQVMIEFLRPIKGYARLV